MPDSQARGVYVDTALLLARCTRARLDTGSIADAFRKLKAYQDRHFDLFGKLDITSLEVPILEERKRGPTRHPKDLEEMSNRLDLRLTQLKYKSSPKPEFFFCHPDSQIRTWLFYWLLLVNTTALLSFDGTAPHCALCLMLLSSVNSSKSADRIPLMWETISSISAGRWLNVHPRTRKKDFKEHTHTFNPIPR